MTTPERADNQQPQAGQTPVPVPALQPGTLAAASKPDTVFNRARKPAYAGLAVVGLFFVGFGGWAAFAPLESAAIAPGQVVVDSRRQTIQHLEGGIIDEIVVHEGDQVNKGDVLIHLSRTRAQASVDVLRGQYLSAIGEKARLTAERDGLENIAFFSDLADETHTEEEQAIITGQTNVFNSRKRYFDGQVEILQQRILQIDEQIEAFQAQEKAEHAQFGLIQEEISAVKELVDKGLERKPRLLALQRAAAEIAGNRGEYQGRIAQIREQIGEFRSQLIDLENKKLNEVTEKLRETEDQIYDVQQRLAAAQDVLERSDIIAPRSGTIVNLRYHTPGGVIRAGEPVMDLVPDDDQLVIDARVNPLDIDVLVQGMPAEVRLTAYSQRSTPILDGKLAILSADAITDTQNNVSYYTARVIVDRSELDELEDVKLVPGMPAEVMLLTGKRTMLDYLMAPITRSIERGMREH